MIFDEHMHEEEGYMMGFYGDYWMSFGWIFMVAWWVAFFIISITIAYLVHKDAVKRRIPNAEVWVLIVLIFNVVGLLVYLLTRGDYTEEYTQGRNK